MKQIVDAIEHTTYTGWLWWKKATTNKYYLWKGEWYNASTHNVVDAKLAKKLTEMWHHMDKFRVN